VLHAASTSDAAASADTKRDLMTSFLPVSARPSRGLPLAPVAGSVAPRAQEA
jgi:hypothetical protein